MSSDWHLFAWQGVRCETPASWEIAAENGDARKGYCRLDDGEINRLEIRWQAGRGGGEIAQIADRYVKALEKKARLPLPRIQRNTRLVEIPDADVETFAWHAETSVTALAMRCRKCGRASLLRTFNPRSEAFRPVAQRVLGSFRDHACDGRVPWAVLEFRFDVPEGYRLQEHHLAAGRLEFEFRGGQATAHAVRVGLAEIALRGRTLADWLKGDVAGLFPRSELDFSPVEVAGHPGVEISGRQRGRWRGLLGRGRTVRCRAWHCDRTNSIQIARWTGPREAAEEFPLFAGSFACHT